LTERDGEVYCKSCYGKNFGPKGYGFSGGGAFMHTEGTNVQPEENTNQNNFTRTEETNTQTKPKFCSSCGSKVTGTGKFCSGCGGEI